jgi:hypothetical protein
MTRTSLGFLSGNPYQALFVASAKLEVLAEKSLSSANWKFA